MEQMDDNKRQEQKRRFLIALKSESCRGNVTVACKNCGLANSSVYKWRTDDAEFRAAWDDTVLEAKDALADEAENALAILVREHNPTAVIFTLKNYRPDKWSDRYAGKEEKKGKFLTYDQFRQFCEQQGLDPATGLRIDTRVPQMEQSQ